jgi:hypothetical protein
MSSHISPANLGAGRCTTRPPSAPLAEAVPISSDAKKYNDHAGFEASDPAGLCQYGMKRDGERRGLQLRHPHTRRANRRRWS